MNVRNVVEILVVETAKDELLLGQIRQNQLRSRMVKSHSLCWRVSKTSEVLFRLLSSRGTVELSGTSTVCPQQIVFGIIKLHVTLIRRIESEQVVDRALLLEHEIIEVLPWVESILFEDVTGGQDLDDHVDEAPSHLDHGIPLEFQISIQHLAGFIG